LTWNQALEKDNKPGVKYLKYWNTIGVPLEHNAFLLS
jgi:hypothetical protein